MHCKALPDDVTDLQDLVCHLLWADLGLADNHCTFLVFSHISQVGLIGVLFIGGRDCIRNALHVNFTLTIGWIHVKITEWLRACLASRHGSRSCARLDAPLSTLAETVAILVEPLADLGPASGPFELAGALEVLHAAIHSFDVASYLSELIPKLILLYLHTASIST